MLTFPRSRPCTNAGEKPFVCPVCGMRFTRNFNMKEHLTKHGSSKPYQCRFCEENFQTRHIRRRHEQDVHRKYTMIRRISCKTLWGSAVFCTAETAAAVIYWKRNYKRACSHGGPSIMLPLFGLLGTSYIRLSSSLGPCPEKKECSSR